MVFRVAVVGGNGFVGSAVCKALVAASARATTAGASPAVEVTSISPSGRAWRNPGGHLPEWTASPAIRWEQGDVLALPSPGQAWKSTPANDRVREIFAQADAVVHTVGILLEADYKPRTLASSSSSRSGGGGPCDVLSGLVRGWTSSQSAPSDPKFSYAQMNTQAALNSAALFSASRKSKDHAVTKGTQSPDSFVYLSAGDLFRPFISAQYITSKRAAEQGITQLANPAPGQAPLFRSIYMRPGLMYHPHNRPLSTVPAAVLDASVHIHRQLSWLGLPTPAGALDVLGRVAGPQQAVATSLAGLLTQDPLHVDTVASAIVRSVLDRSVPPGPKEIAQIKELASWRISDSADRWRPAVAADPAGAV